MSKEQSGLKGSESTPINQRKYAELVAEMRATGQKFPCNQFGKVNLTWVAKKIGCTNKVLEPGGSLNEQFKNDVNSIGVEAGSQSNATLQQKAEAAKRDLSTLKKDLDLKSGECERLKDDVKNLKDKIRRLESREKEKELSFDELWSSGRWFTLG